MDDHHLKSPSNKEQQRKGQSGTEPPSPRGRVCARGNGAKAIGRGGSEKEGANVRNIKSRSGWCDKTGVETGVYL